jgi:hypothetical protein
MGKSGTGIWGTLPELPGNRRRILTQAGFKVELARLVGAERAGEVMKQLAKELAE